MLKRRLGLRSLEGPIALAIIALLALPMAVLANTSSTIAQTGGMTATLPMLGSSLTVDVQLDAVGNISQVNLDPVGTYSASKLSAHAVTFESAGGSTSVKIRARGDKLSIKASAGTLADISGHGTWAADLFGTGTKTKVAYTIGAKPDGSPSVAINSIDAPAGIDVVQGDPTSSTQDHRASAAVKVAFGMNGYTRKLTIGVSVKTEGTRPAKLSITLSAKDRQELTGPLASFVGDHSWSGKTCSGTPVGFTYTVAANGTLSFGVATSGTATAKSSEHGLSVRFDDSMARVKVSLKPVKNSTDYRLTVSVKSGHCLHAPVPLPGVNTPVNPGADQVRDDHRDGRDDSGSKHGHGEGH